MFPIVQIHSLELNHLSEVSKLHVKAFSQSALTLLGFEAVKRYYHWQMTGPHEAIALGAFENGKLTGFLFGGKFNGATTGFLRINKIYLALRVISHPWLITNPLFRERLNLGLNLLNRLPQQNKGQKIPEVLAIRSFGILAIAVHPEFQKKGIGKRLMDEAERIARENQYPLMHLTVDPQNVNAVLFYEKLGWERQSKQNDWKGNMRKYLISTEIAESMRNVLI